MPQNILETIEGLPLRVKQVHESAFALAVDELKLQVVDSSVFLLAIIKLGDVNSSAKWLHSTGLTEEVIIRFIKKDFTARVEEKQVRDSWGKKHSIPAIPVCTQATIKMFNHLGRPHWDTRTAGAVYVATVLEAITRSDSRTVQRIFASVGLGMADVRKQLEIPSITDLGVLYSRSH